MGALLADSQRDAVYRFILFDLNDMGDMATLLRGGEVEQARLLRCRFEEDMLLLDQIGWEQTGKRPAYALTLPSDEIRAIFRRLLTQATQVINESLAEFATQMLGDAFSMVEIAEIVLNELPGGTRHLRSQPE